MKLMKALLSFRIANTDIETHSDLDCLLSILRFWGVETCPLNVLECILMEYWQELAYLKDIHTVMSAPRENALNVALNLSNMSIVEFLLGQGLTYDKESAVIAASTGNLPVLNAIDNTDFIFAQDILVAAAAHGHRNILMEYLQRYPDVSKDKLCLAAAERGQLECLEYLFPPNCDNLPVRMKICECAAKHHQVACFQYMCTPFMPLVRLALHYACRSGNLECLKHAVACVQHSNSMLNNTWELDDFYDIIIGGSVECIEYAFAMDCPMIPALASRKAAQCGNVAIIESLIAHGVSFKNTAAFAARNGHLKALQCLRNHDSTWGNVTIAHEAVCGGHVDCLQYAHLNGCVWDESVTEAAAQNNKLSCLQYLHEQGCPWNAQALRLAGYYNAQECIDYLLKHGCPRDETIES